MLGPAPFLSRGDTLARSVAQHTFLPGRGGGIRLSTRCNRSHRGSSASKLAQDMIDLRLNFIAFPFQMAERIFEYGAIIIRLSSCHELSRRQYIMEVIRSYSA